MHWIFDFLADVIGSTGLIAKIAISVFILLMIIHILHFILFQIFQFGIRPDKNEHFLYHNRREYLKGIIYLLIAGAISTEIIVIWFTGILSDIYSFIIMWALFIYTSIFAIIKVIPFRKRAISLRNIERELRK